MLRGGLLDCGLLERGNEALLLLRVGGLR